MTDLLLLFALAFGRSYSQKQILIREAQFLFEPSLKAGRYRFKLAGRQIVTKIDLDLCDLTWILTNLDTLWFKNLLDILWFKALKLSPSRLEALLWHRLKTKMSHVSIGPKDTLCFQF
jgi:hypothetical protein